MADRHAQILVLLETRYDHLPEQVRRAHTTPGFAHGVDAHVTCPDCFGEQPARVGCETCGGRGYQVERRRRDPYQVNQVTPYGLAGAAAQRELEFTATMGRLEAQLRPPWPTAADELADANLHPEPWEIERARMFARFDYRALELALERLHDGWPGVAATSAQGLELLDGWMPDPIRAPAPAPAEPAPANGHSMNAHALKQRDELIRRQVVTEDRPVQWVARQHGLSPSQVNRICNTRLPSSVRAATIRPVHPR